MGIFDEFKRLAHPYEDEDEDDYEDDFDLCRQAAASLYEFTPRHTLVRRCVEKALAATRDPAEASTLRLMLR